LRSLRIFHILQGYLFVLVSHNKQPFEGEKLETDER